MTFVGTVFFVVVYFVIDWMHSLKANKIENRFFCQLHIVLVDSQLSKS